MDGRSKWLRQNEDFTNAYGLTGKDYVRKWCKVRGIISRIRQRVRDGQNTVSDFEIITVDVVAQPSAPGAYPTPIYEHLMNTKGGYRAINVAKDKGAQKALKESLINVISRLQ